MDSSRLQALERRMTRMERRLRFVCAGWIGSVAGLLLFGVIVRPAFPLSPVPTTLPNVLTVNGIKIVDQRGRETASIDARGTIRGGWINGSALQIGEPAGAGFFSVESFVDPHGLPITTMELSDGPGAASFRLQLSRTEGLFYLSGDAPPNAPMVNGLREGTSVVRMSVAGTKSRFIKSGIIVRHVGDTVWQTP